ncbi:MAG: hypothetical protein AAF467_24540 [Actinomycetota bacterium]
MSKTTDFSATLNKGANEAREILRQTAGLIEAEWARIKDSVEGSETIPTPVKTVVGKVGDAVDTVKREATSEEGLGSTLTSTLDDVRGYVGNVTPQKLVTDGLQSVSKAGVPVPDSWLSEAEAAADTVADAATDVAAEAGDVADAAAETVADAAETVADEAEAAADEAADIVDADIVEDTEPTEA